MAQENFEKISRIIKKEYEAFDIKKAQDFKDTMVMYLEQMLKYSTCNKRMTLKDHFYLGLKKAWSPIGRGSFRRSSKWIWPPELSCQRDRLGSEN